MVEAEAVDGVGVWSPGDVLGVSGVTAIVLLEPCADREGPAWLYPWLEEPDTIAILCPARLALIVERSLVGDRELSIA